MKKKISILYEDDQIIIVNKPAGLLSIPDRYDPKKFNLYHQLQNLYAEVFIVHRLDRETSGAICFARTAAAHRHLSGQFEKRRLQKNYLALVDGIPNPEEGFIDKAIAPHPTRPGRMIADNNGKPAYTDYRLIESFRVYSLLEVRIKTGRTHQIRVHLSAIGHPLIVDSFYNRREAFFLSELKVKKYRLGRGQEERPLIARASLHAHRLTILHPETNRETTFEAPLPKDLKAAINQLRKWR